MENSIEFKNGGDACVLAGPGGLLIALGPVQIESVSPEEARQLADMLVRVADETETANA